MYKQALEANPKHVYNLHNYSQFLLITRHDHVAAEKLLVRGLKVDPDDTDTLSLYGMLLWEYRCGEGLQGGSDEKMYQRVEELLTKAYKTDPKHLANISRLASFYEKVRGDTNKAEELHLKMEKINMKRNNKKQGGGGGGRKSRR